MTFAAKAQEIKKELVNWRRHLHQYPELSFEEIKTSTFVAKELDKIPGIKVERGVGYPTAVVGTLSSGSGPTIAVRADIDALPILEQNNVSYRSKNKGVMHACGHDAHTAIALGTAHLLSKSFQKEEIKGKVKFLFQPAEEHVDETGRSGAPYMIQAGGLENVDAAIALHMSPENRFGEVQINDGYSMANVDVFRGDILATGGHGAYPHLGTDPFWMLNQVLQMLYGISGRRITPLESAVISIGSIHGGSTSNVIPDRVKVQGTIRSYTPETRDILRQEIKKAFGIVETMDGRYELEFIQEDPSLNNDSNINNIFKHVIVNNYPDFKIIEKPFGLGGEDFAHIAKEIPASMFFLGCGVKDEKVRNLHTPHFDIDERVLPVGATILAETAKTFLTGSDNS
ncbi:M20 metallopeptidase family protein [Oceanobacillus halophilus]|uniref:Amidohydrolase n=1 Tax=Oceanobacillus halophilus TaxID=930130 RepID=A0A494ZVE3_9BACI|nr:M20 family metallopeptidase [Oceanobacillus halophilus]RKQ30502.1 amidohydrolase [Oceanobacillus halophilus]